MATFFAFIFISLCLWHREQSKEQHQGLTGVCSEPHPFPYGNPSANRPGSFLLQGLETIPAMPGTLPSPLCWLTLALRDGTGFGSLFPALDPHMEHRERLHSTRAAANLQQFLMAFWFLTGIPDGFLTSDRNSWWLLISDSNSWWLWMILTGLALFLASSSYNYKLVNCLIAENCFIN